MSNVVRLTALAVVLGLAGSYAYAKPPLRINEGCHVWCPPD